MRVEDARPTPVGLKAFTMSHSLNSLKGRVIHGLGFLGFGVQGLDHVSCSLDSFKGSVIQCFVFRI